VSALALGLVLGSAVLHATWNLLAKRAAGGVSFVWWFSLATVIVYGPAVAVYAIVERPAFTATHAALAVGSAAIHTGYFAFLQRGYRAGDLSLVYPLARGTGPVLATLLAIVLLGERPGLQALGGTALVVVGILALAGVPARGGGARGAAIAYGLATGGFIAIYTVWDGFAVGTAGAVPVLYMLTAEAVRTVLLTPSALRRRAALATTWRAHRREIVGVAVLSPLAYLLVLTALQQAPISLVAPLREVSILFAALLGARLLAEGEGARRAVAALVMVAGVALLATV
jgi:drug/metabolite transporter (DMT)-like permease